LEALFSTEKKRQESNRASRQTQAGLQRKYIIINGKINTMRVYTGTTLYDTTL